MKRSSKQRTAGIVGYVRCSTTEQADSGLGLEAQEAKIRAEAERRGLPVLAVLVDAGISGAKTERPRLTEALAMLEAGNGSMLVVAKVDRLARSLRGFAQVMETSQRQGWSVATLDLAGVDTSTPAGSMVANVTASVAQYERELISQRTKDALGAKRARGETLGRPKLLPNAVVDRIRFLRPTNTLQAIADLLNAEGVPTAHGGVKWHPSTVKHVHDAAK